MHERHEHHRLRRTNWPPTGPFQFRGRPRGSRNHLTTESSTIFAPHGAEHGRTALAASVIEKPTEFCRIVASLLPAKTETRHHADTVALPRRRMKLIDGRSDLTARKQCGTCRSNR